MRISITWLGCASYVLDLDGTKLLFDPFFFRNDKSNPVVKTKREGIKDVNTVFITHAHIDHVTDAAWYAENQNTQVYTSATGKDNMKRWCNGEVIDFKSYPLKFMAEPYTLTEKGISNIHVIDWGEKIKISDDIYVESMKTQHIRFDFNTIMARVKSKKFWKAAKALAPLGRGLPKGKVLGYCTFYKGKKIVSSGSLCEKFPEVLKKYENCDVFIVPLAGNSAKHLAKKATEMVDVLKPKILVPTHWDDFFPPISRIENVKPFNALMKEKHPNVKVLYLNADEETALDI